MNSVGKSTVDWFEKHFLWRQSCSRRSLGSLC